MSEVVHWLVAHPERWVIPAVLIVALLGIPVMLVRERRRPSSYTRSQEFLEGVRRWRELSAAEQEARDNAVLDAAEAAELAASRVAEVRPSVVAVAELVVEAEHARTIGER